MKTKKTFSVSVKLIIKDSSKVVYVLSFPSFSLANEAYKDELAFRSSSTGFLCYDYIYNCPVNVSCVACIFYGYRYEVSLINNEH